MFAFAVWDSVKKSLFLARDRIGIKPLYYYFKNGILIFASELKALLEYSGIKREINFYALHDYLTYMCVPEPATIFNDVYKLSPGHMLIYENGKLEIRKYWDVNLYLDKTGNFFKDEMAAAENMNELIKDAVKTHLISDVPLGVFLSGGMDSSTIVSIMSEIAGTDIKTFSIGFEDPYYNELDNARIVAERFGTKHNEYIVSPQSIDSIEDILYYFDEPFADSSAIPTYYVSKYSKGQVTVALSGDGGDEAFGGYGNYKADKIGMFYRKLPSFLKDKVIHKIVGKLNESSASMSKAGRIKKLFKIFNMSPEEGHIFWLSCFSEDAKKKMYYNEHLKQLLPFNSIDRYSSFFKNCKSDDFINSCICVDIKTVLPNDYLTKVDRMSMANSLEVRVPFLDHKLMEFTVSINSKYKLRGLTTKYLFKKIMKNKLPDAIIRGKKKGFSIPLTRWFREDFSVLINEFLSESAIKKRGYFNSAFIKCLCEEHKEGKRDNSKLLWTLICFEIWHRRFIA
jgi:asparagine synthase (glutamine-hydrolysing)